MHIDFEAGYSRGICAEPYCGDVYDTRTDPDCGVHICGACVRRRRELVPADDRLCLCGSGLPWTARLTHKGTTTTECVECFERGEGLDRHLNDHDRTLDRDQEDVSL